VAKAAATVAESVGDAGLAGLVNNAGVGTAWPLELVPLDVLRQQFEVNVFGMVAVTQALLPQLRAGSGRIVTPALDKLEAGAEAAIGRFDEPGREHYAAAFRSMVALLPDRALDQIRLRIFGLPRAAAPAS
jgi:NAD(P)-dependent dehydrogenase (short-subunit alcohol dehydrogenase family)